MCGSKDTGCRGHKASVGRYEQLQVAKADGIAPGKEQMTRDQLVSFIASDAQFADQRELLEKYIRQLDLGHGAGWAAPVRSVQSPWMSALVSMNNSARGDVAPHAAERDPGHRAARERAAVEAEPRDAEQRERHEDGGADAPSVQYEPATQASHAVAPPASCD